MSGFYAYRWKPEAESPRSTLVIFFSNAKPEQSELVALLDRDFRENLQSDAVLVIGPETASAWLSSELALIMRDDALLRFDPNRTPIAYLTFGKVGKPGTLNILSGDWSELQPSFSEVKSAGLISIFERRDVLVRPALGMHFSHPSGVHSAGFLRTANALVDGGEVNFIAMTLLPYLKDDLKRIWIDTSSIASIAYAMISLRQSLDPGYQAPIVESFSSYQGLKQRPLDHATRSIFLISATQSGDLARLIMEKEALPKERVINLFSAARDKKGIEVHCDVSGHPSLHPIDAAEIPTLFWPESCPYCRDGSRLVEFVTDQFLTDAITYSSVLVLGTDAPGTLLC